MAYIPNSPPYSATGKVSSGSPIGKILVTSVTAVTSTHREDRDDLESAAGAVGQCAKAAAGVDNHNCFGVDGAALEDVVSRWFLEHCFLSRFCASSVHSLYLSFCRWASLARNPDLDSRFADHLQRFGFQADEDGMVAGLILFDDLQAALHYEATISFPAIMGRKSKDGVNTMALIITSKPQNFELPSEGEHLSVLADVVDLGETETEYGLKDRLQFVWLVHQGTKDGNLLSVRQRPHNKSLHEKSSLRKDLKRILGSDPGDTFDVECILGVNALLEIEHYTREGRTYANIVAIRRPVNGDHVLQIPQNYKRAESPKTCKRTSKAASDVPETQATEDYEGF